MKQNIHCSVLVPFVRINTFFNNSKAKKVFLIMRLALIILIFINIQVSATTYAQNVTISRSSISLKDAFSEIREQTGFFFIYNNEIVSRLKPISINVKNTPINNVLKEILKNQPLDYAIEDKVIIIKPKNPAASVKQLQNRKLTGKVTDEFDGGPLVGVSVKVKGQTAGTITNVDGVFSVNAGPGDAFLTFSYVGYATKEVAITAANNYNIILGQESKQLKEIVVAFGTSTKRELTSAVTEISSKDIEQRPISNLNSAIAGAAPGVQTSTGSGQPGEGPAIRIRGFSSITNSNDPLYVVDGAPYEGDINSINPDDIESISLLKDAASTALYGARAANGIVMVTTKKGKKNRNIFSVRMTQAFSERALPNYEKVSAYEFYPLMWESLRNRYYSDFPGDNPTLEFNQARKDSLNRLASRNIKNFLGWNPFNVADNEIVLPDGTINPQARLLYKSDLSLQDAMQRTGLRTDASMSLSGGSAKNDYYVSLAYLNEQGFSIGSDFKRYSARVRVNSDPKTWLSTGLSLNGTFSQSDRANENSGINENPFYVDLIMAPIYPVHLHDPFTGAYILDKDGNKLYDAGDYRPMMTGRNILAETVYNINQIRRNGLLANYNLDAKFLKDFKFTTTFSANISNYRSNIVDNSFIGDARGRGRAERRNTMSAFLNFNQLLNYNKKFGDHSFKAIIGHESYYNYYDYLNGSATSEATNTTNVLDNYAVTTGLSGYDRAYKTEGYLSRFDYSYDARYLASFSFRRDGSSKFAKNNRWGNFFSVSGAWNIDREAFFKVDAIDVLKLRASYGEVGNDNVGDYFAYQGLYGLKYNNGTEPGSLFLQVPSPNLEWETNVNADIALEFEVFKSRLTGSLEFYRRQSDNLLFDVSLPLSTGMTSRNDNFGSMRNSGIEVNLTGNIIKQKEVRWSTTLNWTTMGNQIVSLPDSYKGRITGYRRYAEGRSIYEFYLRDWRGVDPATGRDLYTSENPINETSESRFVDPTGEILTINSANARYRYAGSAIPDFYGSFNNTISYKNFSLQVLFLYQYGGLVYDDDYQSLMTRGSTTATALHIDALNRWQKPGDVTNVPSRMDGSTYITSDRFLTDASYINFKSAALTYNLPRKFLNRNKIQSAKVYVNGENLFITSKRKGLDPTQTFTGTPSYTYAPARIVSFGINLTL